MLDSLYTTFFRPTAARFSAPVAIAIGLLIVFVLALNAAGTARLGIGGAIGFILLFAFAGLLGWFWLSAAVNLLAQLLGGRADASNTMQAIAAGLAPLILTAPAIAASKWSVALGNLFSFAISIAAVICDALKPVGVVLFVYVVIVGAWLGASLLRYYFK
ncbi:MAG: hypothetical protein N4J56_004264 [Chroococcidiopsis sp. SAG 2025]|uniref:hypothetical protein n=1 Tax=Chroococcidiopsis sp. SAG 2025 TaxID=171389 RepID=UPI002937321E|nr:hypothetical protein [Chroococcidiopsis sp. SAG 2025]MDV2994610.1 hypothetical protein [Chroococcidiopsis sp. SAG 2025]